MCWTHAFTDQYDYMYIYPRLHYSKQGPGGTLHPSEFERPHAMRASMRASMRGASDHASGHASIHASIHANIHAWRTSMRGGTKGWWQHRWRRHEHVAPSSRRHGAVSGAR